jgi:hypothetical protein
MTPSPSRKSNSVVCYALIAFGVFCVLGTVAAAFYLKNGIIERVRETPSVEGLGDVGRVQTIEQRIKFKEQDIENERRMPDVDQTLEESRRRLGLKTNSNAVSNTSFGQTKSDKIKRLEDEKRQLIEERDALIGRSQARMMKPRSWSDIWEDYGLTVLVAGVVPLGLFIWYLFGFLVSARLPANNPLSLTGKERKSVIFAVFSIVFSAFGFFVFAWILMLVY